MPEVCLDGGLDCDNTDSLGVCEGDIADADFTITGQMQLEPATETGLVSLFLMVEISQVTAHATLY